MAEVVQALSAVGEVEEEEVAPRARRHAWVQRVSVCGEHDSPSRCPGARGGTVATANAAAAANNLVVVLCCRARPRRLGGSCQFCCPFCVPFCCRVGYLVCRDAARNAAAASSPYLGPLARICRHLQ